VADASWVPAVTGVGGVVGGVVVGWGLNALTDARKRRADEREREKDRWHDYRRDAYARLAAIVASIPQSDPNDTAARDAFLTDVHNIVAQIELYSGSSLTTGTAYQLANELVCVLRDGAIDSKRLVALDHAFKTAVREEFGLKEFASDLR
jgi:hypothetical protein